MAEVGTALLKVVLTAALALRLVVGRAKGKVKGAGVGVRAEIGKRGVRGDGVGGRRAVEGEGVTNR